MKNSILSRHVIVDGHDKGLCVVTTDSQNIVTDIHPFIVEEHSVQYIDSPVYIKSWSGSRFGKLILKNDDFS